MALSVDLTHTVHVIGAYASHRSHIHDHTVLQLRIYHTGKTGISEQNRMRFLFAIVHPVNCFIPGKSNNIIKQIHMETLRLFLIRYSWVTDNLHGRNSIFF